jgi:hypothetical protein
VKWLVRLALSIAVLYVLLSAAVVVAMLQPPERFGQIMKRVPAPIVWGVLPGRTLWLWARRGQRR